MRGGGEFYFAREIFNFDFLRRTRSTRARLYTGGYSPASGMDVHFEATVKNGKVALFGILKLRGSRAQLELEIIYKLSRKKLLPQSV